MVGQHTPGVYARGDRKNGVQESAAELAHPLGGKADVRFVVQAGCGEMIPARAAEGVRRAVPREGALLAPGEQPYALLRRELAPEVSHGSSEAG